MSLRPENVRVFACPKCGGEFHLAADVLRCDCGHTVPVVRGVPRFVASDAYVESFSFEWTVHKETQVDLYRDDRVSERELESKTGLQKADVEGKLVLDAGVGVGRFADVISRWGGTVFGVDLSRSVESAQANLGERDNVVIAQADIGALPFRPGTFDQIISMGVLHHTPDTKAYFDKLVPLLRPGGRITIWVYPSEVESYRTRAAWIPFTRRIPIGMFYDWCRWFAPFATSRFDSRWIQLLYRVFPFSNQGRGVDYDILDLFDGYSPRYHGIHSAEEVMDWFRAAGLSDVQSLPTPTSVTGVRPAGNAG